MRRLIYSLLAPLALNACASSVAAAPLSENASGFGCIHLGGQSGTHSSSIRSCSGDSPGNKSQDQSVEATLSLSAVQLYRLTGDFTDSSRSFSLSSFNSTYPLVATVTGRLRVDEDSIRVDVDSGIVQNRLPLTANYRSQLDSVDIRVATAHAITDGWEVEVRGTRSALVTSLGASERIALMPIHLAVARAAGDTLSSRWLVFELRAHHHGLNGRAPGPFTTYVCSGETLDGTASVLRAALLTTNYNLVC